MRIPSGKGLAELCHGLRQSTLEVALHVSHSVSSYIAIMRAINVPGHGRVMMSDVRDAFATAGCSKIGTFIQSGNIVFESSAREVAGVIRKVTRALRTALNEEPVILLRTPGQIQALIGRAPFVAVQAELGIKLYVAFLSKAPRHKPKLPVVSRQEALELVGIRDREAFIVSRRKKNGFFGIPNTFVEKELGVCATCRNWSTITKIVKFAQALSSGSVAVSRRGG
jgi:uncharacterized protein (DUF1697 family)